ncbi:TPA: 2,3-bisphosphoglycerate-independent phosphoglycerate mutase [Candidatus Woesearchaeota archaeon]|nr:2,3-bisphosphoglycerate-independent phosphoglycerate mutase [Candidatus Woesearchaeota archaeon]
MLIVLDGWGYRKAKRYNAIAAANTPFFDEIWKQNPHTTLYAAQQYVGLPKGYIGNSEVGHTHLGAGRMVPQELFKINNAIKDRSFYNNKVLLTAMQHAKRNGSGLHLLGLVSDGGVHSHIDHLFVLLEMAKKHEVKRVHVHCILDGRDTPPKSAEKYLKKIDAKLKNFHNAKITTLMGRFYAMDRDNRWQREHKAYDAMVNNEGLHYKDWQTALKDAYGRGETDEFVSPSIIESGSSCREGDSIIFFNFREDRARELTRAFVQGKFKKFKRKKIIDLNFACMVQYDKAIQAPVAFPPEVPPYTMGEILSGHKIRQFRIAETEKYAHVTYFFNGGREGPFPGEDRKIIPSPRVRTYDLQPEMSAQKVSSEAVKKIKTGKYGFIVLNFANPDMVGHTGKFEQTIKALEVVDAELEKVVVAARSKGYNVIVTADHGNAEEMHGKYLTSHTLNKVPMILLGNKHHTLYPHLDSSIAQMTPTLLKLMGLPHEKHHFSPLI